MYARPGRSEDANSKRFRRMTMTFIALTLVGMVIGILTPAGLDWDFANFYDTGRRMAVGQIADIYDPNSKINGAEPQGSVPFWGTPLSAWLYVPLSFFSPVPALIVFKLQNSFAYLLAFVLLFRFNRGLIRTAIPDFWRYAALYTGICLIYQPVWSVYRIGGQATATVFLLFTAGLVAHTRQWFMWSSICAVAAVTIKPGFSIALLILMCVSGKRFFVATCLASIGAVLLSLGLTGWDINEQFIRKLATGVSFTAPWCYNSSIFIVIEHIRQFAVQNGDSHIVMGLFSLSNFILKFVVVLLLVSVFCKMRWPTLPSQEGSHFVWLIALIGSLLLGQTIWEHYLVILFLPLSYLVAFMSYWNRSARFLLIAIIILIMGQNVIIPTFMRAQFSFDSLAFNLCMSLIKAGPLILTIIFLVRHTEAWRDAYAGYGWTKHGRGA